MVNVLLAVCLASPLLFVSVLWLTRAGGKRASAALGGCITATVFSLGWDTLATRMGWWSYATDDLLATLTFAVTIALVFGGTAGLVGWRMMRGMGWTGAATFFFGFVGLGLLRDNMLEVNTTLFAFGPGPMPHLMAGVGYLSMALVVQITMLLMAGPPARDPLRGPVSES